jgi:hypothetical protein
MSKFSVITHLLLIVIAIAIGVLYIKPTIEKIAVIEDQTALYDEEAKKVSEVNQMLSQKLSVVDSVTPADKENLLRYLPDTIDDITVMKDIVAIFNRNTVDITDIKYTPDDEPSESDDDASDIAVAKHNFNLSTTLTYDQLIGVLRALEVNNYLLQVSSLKLMSDDIGQLKLDMTLTAFTKIPRTDISNDVAPQI